MERSIFHRNMSFAVVALLAISVSVITVTNKVDLAGSVATLNRAVATSITKVLHLDPILDVKEEQLVEGQEPVAKKAAIVRKTDLQCMAENIYYEASNQSYVGKVAVARVVLNRMTSGDYPATVCGVVYDGSQNTRTSTCQFSWTCAPRKSINKESAAWAQSEAVAKEVLANKDSLDITEGARFYHATYVSPSWRKSLRKVAQIDDHIFYR